LLWWAISEGGIVTAVELRNPAYFLPAISPTFHGRDIFAPVAAYLAKGVPISEFGSEVSPDELVQLPPLRAEVGDRLIVARVIHIDRFGNAITNLREEDFAAWAENLGWRTWRAIIRGGDF
jgi:S-adenosylmethionine hydrolase